MTTAPCTTDVAAELRNAGAAVIPHDDYIVAVNGVRALLRMAGRDPDEDDVLRTPDRVVKALVEMAMPTGKTPAELLTVTFSGRDTFATDDMIALGPVPFTSLCEHHLLPFTGHAWIAYLPADGRVVGLSKLARLVDWHAHALQVQERLTKRITDDVKRFLDVKGAACMIEASHSCLSARGANKGGALMRTSSLTGEFRTDNRRGVDFIAFCDANRP